MSEASEVQTQDREAADTESGLSDALEQTRSRWSVGLEDWHSRLLAFKDSRAQQDHGFLLNLHNTADARLWRRMAPVLIGGDRMLAALRNGLDAVGLVHRKMFSPKSKSTRS
ncbi:hypothetical protein A3A54_01495 [Candidatus Curtissbacteria bacterium RIFCSPLOWO2_01_FULL_39_62]|uniref:Uncharacterized protein n=2 Tax=Candidatus Curtissiibacteriota TaxID=1752717 RepID=A0A1F5G6H1_9BACT|nr:MAG: hypothetical protein A2775_02320 [Candidatus Curtissbacteria bacterium RIFCSPHIGHO2_01_FULL_39_57]OGD87483.1 MAG: hypothetical protein A3D04_04155 [Candidatus Curtissbacteria bacterium RIFCSPHIGHO2_02_FULL_40_16b]OGD91111.1 MAG: hypothetical protein A3E11_01635 [Candidatus Curtissbacteria bacterium RIFCSPHIGHO2_12_FULL_38_37]OGD99549.1 MAG: hypothetical protein A3J17_00140 [Candidatus Curtissbacteria bacterium RIFCSPLOWO2_02_FULL_40_11]OGE02861.1 MAG: hypothetical protein A3A54_01495 [C